MSKLLYVFIILLFANSLFSQQKVIPLTEEGFIPAWLVAGPFEQPLTGFGVPSDSDAIGEKTIEPYPRKVETDALVMDSMVQWKYQSVNKKGLLNFNSSLRWIKPGSHPEKIWYAITGYAAAYINSESAQSAVIKFGSNSFGKIFVNGREVYKVDGARNAAPDQDEIKINLKKGKNLLLAKVGNSHNNHGLSFFIPIEWEWGFYLRLLNENNEPLQNVSLILPDNNVAADINIVSTFFFKDSDDGLQQRFDLEINSPFTDFSNGSLTIDLEGDNKPLQLDSIPFGYSRREIYLPELKSDVKAAVKLNIGGDLIEKEILLELQPHYEMHVMMLNHTDIGYTHPQPVVKEIHSNTLDDVVKMSEEYPEFKWTIETMWQLEQYKQSRTPEQFNKLIALIEAGRIAVSPLYSNPFTGWVGEEEMIHSLSLAQEYKEKYGLKYNAAVYNDVPGQAWFIPAVLNNAGVNFVAEGINEFFNNYTFQRSLPKAFIWEGSDGSRVTAYLNAAYNEGRSYALETKNNIAIEQKLWERINNLKAKGYDYKLILINAAFSDNSILPADQFYGMKGWNDEYAYPKFISSNVSDFAEEFMSVYKDSLPVLRGDWTSNWDIYYQGEPKRMKEHRWVQHNLLSAEKLITLSSLVDNKQEPLNGIIDHAYRSMLNFSGHGSGLEYGYGSPADNLITMDFRNEYVNDAFMDTEELLQRAMFRFGKPEESFDGEGVIIFNTLSWERNTPVQVQFTAENQQQYEVTDLVTGEKVPSFRDHYKLFFIAEKLPPIGYKKYRFTPVAEKSKTVTKEITVSGNSLENQFYKIAFSQNGEVQSITDKKTGKELIDKTSDLGFNQPLIEQFQKNEKYRKIQFANSKVVIKDESPVRVIYSIIRDNELFEKSDYTLWNNIDRIDITHTVNLEKLKQTEYLEDYSIAFPFALNNQQEKIGILGGYINPDEDKLPGSGEEGFSIRRSVYLFNESESISWSSIDGRVIRLRPSGKDSNKVIIANIVNNFPNAWNRYEENEGKVEFNFSFSSNSGSNNISETSRFGWEVNTPPVIRRSWYKTEPAMQSYFHVDNKNVSILALKPGKNNNEFSMRLINMNGESDSKAEIKSDFLRGVKASYITFMGDNKIPVEIKDGSVKVTLKPNEISTLKIVKDN